MTKQDYAALTKAGKQIEPINGVLPAEYMEALYEYIDSVEFVPALQIGDAVEFEHNGATYAGKVDWVLSDGHVSVMVEGKSQPFIGEQKIFKRID